MNMVKMKFQATKNNVKEDKEEYHRPQQDVGEKGRGDSFELLYRLR